MNRKKEIEISNREMKKKKRKERFFLKMFKVLASFKWQIFRVDDVDEDDSHS
jgi:hypothetical protein